MKQTIIWIALAMFVIVGINSVYANGSIYVAVEGGSDAGIWRLEDKNNDGDAMDAGERKGFAANGSVGFMDVAAASDGTVYAIAPDESRVYRLVDLNNDGDARDPGEKTVYRDDNAPGIKTGAPLSIAVYDFFDPLAQTVRTWVYVMDIRHQLTMRLEDLNNDGDAQDSGEMVIIQQSTSLAPLTAERMTTDELGRIVACNPNNHTVICVTDINDDGFVLPPSATGQDCPTPSCGLSDFNEYHVIRGVTGDPETLNEPFGVALGGRGDYFVSDLHKNNMRVVKLSDLNQDGDAKDVGEFLVYYLLGVASRGFDVAAMTVEGNDVVFAAISRFNASELIRLSDANGDGDAMDLGESKTFATFDSAGKAIGLAVKPDLPPPMYLLPLSTIDTPKGPILVVEGSIPSTLTIQVIDRATDMPVPGVRVASYVLQGCFSLCPLSDRTDASGEITYQVTRTATSLDDGEALKFWVYGDAVVITIVPEPCGPEPLADAGPDQETFSGLSVTLDGSASIGDSLFYCWQQVGGPDVGLPECTPINTASPTKTFTAPTAPATLTFELIVRNMCGFVSTPDTVVVTVAECPAEVVLDDAASLAILTQFRDQALSPNSIGQQVISGYYLHGIEMSTILMTRSGLRRRAFQLITDTMPQITELVQQGSVVVEQTTLQAAAKFLNDVRRISSPGLKQFLGQVRQWLLDENVLAQFGVTVQ